MRCWLSVRWRQGPQTCSLKSTNQLHSRCLHQKAQLKMAVCCGSRLQFFRTKSFPTSSVAERRNPPACISEMTKPPPPMKETLMKAPPVELMGPPPIHFVLEGIAFLGDTSVSNVEPHNLGYSILFKFCRTAYIAAPFDITVLGCFFAYIRSTTVSMRCTAWCFGNI